jgi:hypothetical protein
MAIKRLTFKGDMKRPWRINHVEELRNLFTVPDQILCDLIASVFLNAQVSI